jgi:ABC-type branched-subunit amino acid transport system ATPase component
MTILSVEKISVSYGSAKVLTNVFLQVDEGEMVFIVGRNGAGKTTLLKTIAGFLTPSSGTIKFEDSDVNMLSAEDMAERGVRYVFQDKRVFTKLTVKENIQLAAFAAGVGLNEAIEKSVQIYPPIVKFLESKADTLSGGQRQLLLLGRVLIGEPRLLLIDEPTEGLAAGIIKDVFKVLEMTKRKISMLIVEQNLGVVRRLADRVYAMKEGHIVAEFSTPEEIQNPLLEKFL